MEWEWDFTLREMAEKKSVSTENICPLVSKSDLTVDTKVWSVCFLLGLKWLTLLLIFQEQMWTGDHPVIIGGMYFSTENKYVFLDSLNKVT